MYGKKKEFRKSVFVVNYTSGKSWASVLCHFWAVHNHDKIVTNQKYAIKLFEKRYHNCVRTWRNKKTKNMKKIHGWYPNKSNFVVTFLKWKTSNGHKNSGWDGWMQPNELFKISQLIF